MSRLKSSIFRLQSSILSALLAAGLLGGNAYAGLPKVTVSAATGIGLGVGTINGTLVSNGDSATTVYLCWGTNDFGTASTSAWTVVGCGTKSGGQSVSNNLTGLLWGLRYWYRAYATNAAGVGWSDATNFVTAAQSGTIYSSLMGSYFVGDYRGTYNDDWRAAYPGNLHSTVSYPNPRLDTNIQFAGNGSASWATGGNDANRTDWQIGGNSDEWDNFSVQWDGNITIATAGTILYTSSDDGSRLWVDMNGNGVIDTDGSDTTGAPAWSAPNGALNGWVNNNFVSGQGDTMRQVSGPLAAGTYKMRLQYEQGTGGTDIYFCWSDSAHTNGTHGSYWIIPAAYFTTSYSLNSYSITNTTATAVGATQATLNGVLPGISSFYDVWAYWGPTDGANNPGGWTHSAYAGAFMLSGTTTSTNIAYTAASGIAASNGYWYTLCASNAATNVWATPSKGFITGEVTVQATDPSAQCPFDTGAFTIFRPWGCTNAPLTVYYTMSGSATNGMHYNLLSSNATILAGDTSTVVTLTPKFVGVGNAILTLLDGYNYPVGASPNNITSQILITNAITVRSFERGLSGATNTTINAGNVDGRRVVYVNHAGAVLDGFTITGGTKDNGAGVYLAAGTVQNCRITANNGLAGGCTGVGMWVGAGGLVSNCLIFANAATKGQGAGIYIDGGIVRHCTISDNRLDGGDEAIGGGIRSASSATLVESCIIANNSVSISYWGHGGGYYGRGTLRNCLIAGNSMALGATLTSYGGGVCGDFWSPPALLENCTVVGNDAPDGGGVCRSTVTNSIVWDNTATVNFNYSDYSESTFINYSCTTPLPVTGVGNIDGDPRFVNAAGGDYRLRAGPAVNSGTNQTWMVGETDLAGNPRILNAVVDMGAYETYVLPRGTMLLLW